MNGDPSDGGVTFYVFDILRRRGWEREIGRRGTWARHRCGSLAEVKVPDVALVDARSAADAIHAATDAIDCYCVPDPPKGWDPDDDLPATRGDLKRWRKEIENLIRGRRW